jgi:hypothetical protein
MAHAHDTSKNPAGGMCSVNRDVVLPGKAIVISTSDLALYAKAKKREDKVSYDACSRHDLTTP